MSIVKTYSVFCDGEEAPGRPCPGWTSEITDSSHPRPAAEARRLAKRAGWTRVRRGGQFIDLCDGEHGSSHSLTAGGGESG